MLVSNGLRAAYYRVFLLILAVIAVFLILRWFWCWYWKIDSRLEEQKKTNSLLEMLMEDQMKTNVLLQSILYKLDPETMNSEHDSQPRSDKDAE